MAVSAVTPKAKPELAKAAPAAAPKAELAKPSTSVAKSTTTASKVAADTCSVNETVMRNLGVSDFSDALTAPPKSLGVVKNDGSTNIPSCSSRTYAL